MVPDKVYKLKMTLKNMEKEEDSDKRDSYISKFERGLL